MKLETSPMTFRPLPSLERVKKLLHYDPDTGDFTWLISRPPASIGKNAGCNRGRYKRICIDLHQYPAHRLAYLYMTGAPPPNQIDHIDGNGLNNRWNNLREANASDNAANKKRSRTNTSGFKGVCYDKNCHESHRWRASIPKAGPASKSRLIRDGRESTRRLQSSRSHHSRRVCEG